MGDQHTVALVCKPIFFTFPCRDLKGLSHEEKIIHFVEASATRGTTALVYYWINSSLYTGTVQGW